MKWFMARCFEVDASDAVGTVVGSVISCGISSTVGVNSVTSHTVVDISLLLSTLLIGGGAGKEGFVAIGTGSVVCTVSTISIG